MHVVIDDGDARYAAMARVGCRNRDVVEQAKSHRAVPLGVVPGRPHHRERAPAWPIEDMLDGCDRRPRGQECDLI